MVWRLKSCVATAGCRCSSVRTVGVPISRLGAFSVMYNFSDSSFTALILSLSDLSSRWWGWVVSECLCQAELSHCGQEWPAAAGSVSWALDPGHRVITWPHHHQPRSFACGRQWPRYKLLCLDPGQHRNLVNISTLCNSQQSVESVGVP